MRIKFFHSVYSLLARSILQFGIYVPMFLFRTWASLGSFLGSEVRNEIFSSCPFSGAKFGIISLNGQVR